MEQQNKIVKLIRNKLANLITKDKTGEIIVTTNTENLNKLFSLKVVEELEEILENIKTNKSAVSEFCDLIQVTIDWAFLNGYSKETIYSKLSEKAEKYGVFRNDLLVIKKETEEIENNKNNYQNEYKN